MTTTAAVIVTYNRLDLLKQTLSALEAQSKTPDCLIIVDNASTDGTFEYLRQRSYTTAKIVHRLAENIGGSGGFAHGVKIAYERGFDSIWLMDDDTVPRPEALDHLLSGMDEAEEALGFRPSFACSTVLWTDGTICEMNVPVPTWDFSRMVPQDKNLFLVRSCSFVSVMIDRAAIEAVGFPIENFFIWYDDAEYTQRLSKFRPGVYVPESKVDHLLGQNRGMNYGDITDDNLWKFEYGVRNQVAASIKLRSLAGLSDLAENFIKQSIGSPVSRRNKLRIVKAAARGLFFRPRAERP